ncbi:MAG: M60 family metallopeptidase [Clostridia bacterium]|nr:M60 family metallopeptidase [Clostridia bacterium]
MKLKLKYWLTAFLSAVFLAAAIWAVVPVISASADTGNLTCATASGNYLNEDYVSVYKVPTSMMTYESAGGEASGAPLSNAFDGNWNTYWQTGRENAGQGSANPTFLNAITVTFSQPVTIQNILYASSSAREGHGYPTTLNIYTATDGGELSLYGTYARENPKAGTNDRVVFTLSEAVTVTQVKFEFRVVNTTHNWTATAKEIQFLQPDNADVNKVLDLFDDYAQLSVKEEYRNGLSEIRQGVSDLISYESALKPLLDRADAIMDGHLKKDIRREFSTDKNAENVITQYGNLRSYAGNTLKLSQFGINRQVTGVAGLTGQTITVYVDAPAGDPLPSVVCTQVHGDWRSWYRTFNLSRGKNVITFPNFVTGNYSRAVTPGGPIHIVNAYEPSQQSSNVKVYIEGGYTYPVFRKGGDETTFRDELTSYYNKFNAEGLNDVVELVGDHFLHTASASRAYNDFINRKVSPQKNAEGWDNYLTAFLKFDGISMDPADEHFNEKNLHLYTNFRKVQPWGGAGAFAYGEHIGFITFGEDSMTSFGTPGWGVAHEIGHSLDCTRREISETTNNMWSKFELAYFSKNVSRNQNAWITNNLTPDETAVDFGLFNRNREVYQIWWNIETYFPGYWGRLDNNYRYYNETAARTAAGVTSEDGNLTSDERMAYFSSLATGVDLGYYFERCSFSFSSSGAFRLNATTNAYKKLVQKAIDDGVIKEKTLKLWYLDADQYFFDMTGSGCYNSSSSVEIVSANKTSAGYVLYLPKPNDADAHLGYEIMEYRSGNWYVIGFTYARSFTDTKVYANGYVPQYKIRAYDRLLNCTAESSAKNFSEICQTSVCRIGNTYYNSLSEAVTAATAGATIYVCANLFDVAMTINKNLTILPDTTVTGSVTITKSAAGALFTVNNNVTLNLGAADGAKIVLDGNSFLQNGALIKVDGGGARLNAYNAELRNNYNTDHGGAVYNTGGSTFTNVTMKNNTTSQNGGAIANFSGGVITLTGCTLSNNFASKFGGALTLDGRTTLTNVTITGNEATNRGGAIYMACGNNSRAVSIEGGEISGNTSNWGSAIYLDNGTLTIAGGATSVQISGQIFKNEGTLNISTALPDFSNVTFRPASSTEGTVLLTASGNLTFTEEFVKGLNVLWSVAYLGNNNKAVLVKPNTATVTLNVNGNAVQQTVILGDFVLPETAEDLGEDKYISAWKSNGNSYSAGETVNIERDCTFTAEIGTKFTVTLKYDDSTIKTYYVIPDTKFYLPVDSESEQYKITGWTVGESWYAPAAGVTVTGNTEIIADLIKLFKVTLTENDVQSVSWHEYSSSIILQECAVPEGKEFSHWDVNGVAYNVGDEVHLTGDTVINAVFKDMGGNDDGNGNKSNAWVAAVIIIVVLLVVGGMAVAAVFIVKRKYAVEKSDGEDKKE